jgi:hypothetical protein
VVLLRYRDGLKKIISEMDMYVKTQTRWKYRAAGAKELPDWLTVELILATSHDMLNRDGLR